LQRSLLGATAHVTLLARDPSEGIPNWRDLDPRLRKLAHVTSATPGLYGTVLVSGPVQSAGAYLKGIPVEAPPDLLIHLKEGSIEDLKKASGFPGIVLGSRLAQSTGMLLHSVVHVISPQGELTPMGPHITRYPFRVVGIFETGFFDI